MRSLLFVLLCITLVFAIEFPTIKFSEEEQQAALEFWDEKSMENVQPMPIPVINDQGELVEDEIQKYYNYIVQDFEKNITKSTSPVPRNQYGNHPFKYAGKLLFQTSRGQSSW